jgi:hypothetical protein
MAETVDPLYLRQMELGPIQNFAYENDPTNVVAGFEILLGRRSACPPTRPWRRLRRGLRTPAGAYYLPILQSSTFPLPG